MVQKPILKDKRGIFIPKNLLFAMSFIALSLTLLNQAGYIHLNTITSAILNPASITGSGDYIDRPVFYYDKCEAVGSLSYSTPTSLATDGQWLPKPSATDQYNVVLTKGKGTFGYGNEQFEYWVCNSQVQSISNCRVANARVNVEPYKQYTITGIKNNEVVWAQSTHVLVFDRRGASGATYQIGYIPFAIRQYNVLGGSANAVVPNSCTYDVLPKDTILGTDADKVNQFKPSVNTNQRTLQPNEVRWYVAGYLTSKAESFTLTYKGTEAWCRPTGASAEIYQVNKIQTGQGAYKVASADWSDYLGSELCCPGAKQGDATCSNDFKWVQTTGTQCSTFNPCGGANWVPYSDGQIIRYQCVSGTCQPEIKQVECASDFDCKDTNQLCDLNQNKCVQANVNLQGQVIFTIPDNPTDCAAKGGTWITKSEEKGNIFSFVGLTDPKVVVTEYCQLKKPFNFAFWFALIGIGVLLFMFRAQVVAGFRFLLGKIGVRI